MTMRDGSGAKTALAEGTYHLQPGGAAGHLQLVSKSGAVTKGLVAPVLISPRSQPLKLNDSAGIGFAGDHWHGSFRVIESGSSLLCVNVVGMEKYLRGVVPSEMPASWMLPALKAQAVAARSYAFATRNPAGDFDAYADTRSQVYGPIEHEAAASTAAVVDTAHLVVWYRRTVATTFFSSSSGGRTASEQAAWGTTFGEPYPEAGGGQVRQRRRREPEPHLGAADIHAGGACPRARSLGRRRIALDDDRRRLPAGVVA